MPGCDGGDGYGRRVYKKWRYPGVPIPRRLQSTYTIDGKPPRWR